MARTSGDDHPEEDGPDPEAADRLRVRGDPHENRQQRAPEVLHVSFLLTARAENRWKVEDGRYGGSAAEAEVWG